MKELNYSERRLEVNVENYTGAVKNVQHFDLVQLEVIPEPLEKWCDMKGHNLLKLFYENPKKTNFLFQHYVQLTRLMDTIKKLKSQGNDFDFGNNGARVRIMERSLQNNRYCFIEMARKQGDLEDAEHSVLVEWYNWLESNLDLKLDVIIYLQTEPGVVYSRMKSRGRSEEATVPLEYLTALHDTYENWLVNQNPEDPSRKQEVVVVNANQGKEEVFEEAKTRLMEHFKKNRPEIFCAHEGSYVLE
ncbi:unnamed protein product [Allacma fusca]|uniref:Deoxynucleoside kinase domain-containing protein n=1 Tax=Allacma fusca TaxID=39272 RepID=A0A8J2PZS0_9HEXA|nr:unnamed protein product [Allacma fusca]